MNNKIEIIEINRQFFGYCNIHTLRCCLFVVVLVFKLLCYKYCTSRELADDWQSPPAYDAVLSFVFVQLEITNYIFGVKRKFHCESFHFRPCLILPVWKTLKIIWQWETKHSRNNLVLQQWSTGTFYHIVFENAKLFSSVFFSSLK